MDTIALDSPDGWTMLANNLEQQRLGIQSPYIPLPSTAEEFEAYYRKAGFGAIHTERRGSLLMVTAVKRDARPAFPVEAVAAETA